MESGDLDNRPAERIIYVFESTIGTLPGAMAHKRNFHLKARQWKRAAQCWEVDPHIVKVLVDLAWRSPYNVDVATYTNRHEAEEIEERLSVLGVPFGHFYTGSLEEMTRGLVNMPHIAAVYDFDTARRFAYGAKGRTVVGL